MKMKSKISIGFSIALALLYSPVFAQEKSMIAEGAMVYIVSPADGATVSSPVKVIFGLSGAGVAPAGIQAKDTGHHHLIVDAALPDTNMPVPSDANNLHFGKGQTETTVELSSGQHTLQLLLGDWLHIPHASPVASEVITITVE